MPRILVVEDDVAMLDLVAVVLRDDGFEVDTAKNGAAGITKVRDSSPPNVIVLDLMMPVMDGWEFMRHYRQMPRCASTPILVMSAIHRSSLELPDKCEFLAKPFDVDELSQAVTRLAAGA